VIVDCGFCLVLISPYFPLAAFFEIALWLSRECLVRCIESVVCNVGFDSFSIFLSKS
jgi:hypothetical protein